MDFNEFENEMNSRTTNKQLAVSAVKNILIMQTIKWGLIIGITKALKRAAEKAQS